mmetsp:Transcript_12069/g.36219  ORF Transcript_12069/g.36219 Transcript_12069/m.36219 type:complete len:277 (-) Transcript_12069:561-1391(-)
MCTSSGRTTGTGRTGAPTTSCSPRGCGRQRRCGRSCWTSCSSRRCPSTAAAMTGTSYARPSAPHTFTMPPNSKALASTSTVGLACRASCTPPVRCTGWGTRRTTLRTTSWCSPARSTCSASQPWIQSGSPNWGPCSSPSRRKIRRRGRSSGARSARRLQRWRCRWRRRRRPKRPPMLRPPPPRPRCVSGSAPPSPRQDAAHPPTHRGAPMACDAPSALGEYAQPGRKQMKLINYALNALCLGRLDHVSLSSACLIRGRIGLSIMPVRCLCGSTQSR